MNKVQEILKAFWKFTDDYDGEISCRKIDQKGGCEFYEVETESNTYTAAIWNNTEYEPDKNIVFFKLVEDCGVVWRTTDGVSAIEIDGCPRLAEFMATGTSKTPSELATESGVSVATVYNRAKQLGRLPTVEELKRRPSGRPRKYN